MSINHSPISVPYYLILKNVLYIGVVFLVVNLIAGVYQYTRSIDLESRLTDEIEEINTKNDTLQEQNNALYELIKRYRYLKSSYGATSGNNITYILSLLENTLPSDMRILELMYERDKSLLRAKVITNNNKSIVAFIQKLEQERTLSDISLEKQQQYQKNNDYTETTISIQIRD